MLKSKNKLLIMLSIIIITSLFIPQTVNARDRDIDILEPYDEKVVYVDEVPEIGEEIYYDSSNYYPYYEFNGNLEINEFEDVTMVNNNLTMISKDKKYKDLSFRTDKDTIFGIKFVDDDNNYNIVSFQKVELEVIKNIIKNQTNYGTKHYFNGYYNHPRIGYYYRDGLTKDTLKVLYISYHVSERKEGIKTTKVENTDTDKIDKETLEILLDLEKVDILENLKYRDFIPVENIKKAEVYNDSHGMEYFVDYNDGEMIHIENKKENSILFYIAIKDKNDKYTYYKLDNDMGTFNFLREKTKRGSLYKQTIIVIEGNSKDNIERMTLYLRKN